MNAQSAAPAQNSHDGGRRALPDGLLAGSGPYFLLSLGSRGGEISSANRPAPLVCHRYAAGRSQRQAATNVLDGAGVDEAQAILGEQRAEHDLHLVHSESGAEAATRPPPERCVLEHRELPLEEALGDEPVR